MAGVGLGVGTGVGVGDGVGLGVGDGVGAGVGEGVAGDDAVGAATLDPPPSRPPNGSPGSARLADNATTTTTRLARRTRARVRDTSNTPR
jgi:hypothetical protein